jgi:hypothetical protein
LRRDSKNTREGSIVGPPGGTFDEDFVGSTPPRASFSAAYGLSEVEEEEEEEEEEGEVVVVADDAASSVAAASPFPPSGAAARAVVQPRRRTIGERPARRARVTRVLAATSPRALRRGAARESRGVVDAMGAPALAPASEQHVYDIGRRALVRVPRVRRWEARLSRSSRRQSGFGQPIKTPRRGDFAKIDIGRRLRRLRNHTKKMR